MGFQGKVASTSGDWRLVARKGNLIERVYSGMRVGEDSTACLSLEPQHALVELGIEHDLLSVRVLPRQGESATPPIWVNLQAKVQVNLPNNVFLLTPEGETDDSDTDLIEIQVRPKPVTSNVPAKKAAVPFAGGEDIDFGKRTRLLPVNVSIALAALGMLVLIPLVFLAREIADGAVNVQAEQDAKVTDVDSSTEDVVVSLSDNTALGSSAPDATSQPQFEEVALGMEEVELPAKTESANLTADKSIESNSLADPARNTDLTLVPLASGAKSTTARSDLEKAVVAFGTETRAPVITNLGEPDEAEFGVEPVVAPSPQIPSNSGRFSAGNLDIDESTDLPASDVARQLAKAEVDIAAASPFDTDSAPDSIATPREDEQAASVPPANPELLAKESAVVSPIALDTSIGEAGANFSTNETAETLVLPQPEQTERTLPIGFGLSEADDAEVDTSGFLSEGFETELGLVNEMSMQRIDGEIGIEEDIQQSVTPSLEMANLATVETESELALGKAPPSLAAKQDSDLPSLYPFSDLTVLRQRQPVYPRVAPTGTSGFVDIEFTVTEKGRVDDMEVRGNPPDFFARAALNALRRWRFEAIIVDGKPVPVRTVLRLSFRG